MLRRMEQSRPWSFCSIRCQTSLSRLCYRPPTAWVWTWLTALYGGFGVSAAERVSHFDFQFGRSQGHSAHLLGEPWPTDHQHHQHNRFTALFPGPPGWAGARREMLHFVVQGKINRGRHTHHPAGRHSIWTNQCPPPPFPTFYRPDALPATQPTVSKQWTTDTGFYWTNRSSTSVNQCCDRLKWRLCFQWMVDTLNSSFWLSGLFAAMLCCILRTCKRFAIMFGCHSDTVTKN